MLPLNQTIYNFFRCTNAVLTTQYRCSRSSLLKTNAQPSTIMTKFRKFIVPTIGSLLSMLILLTTAGTASAHTTSNTTYSIQQTAATTKSIYIPITDSSQLPTNVQNALKSTNQEALATSQRAYKQGKLHPSKQASKIIPLIFQRLMQVQDLCQTLAFLELDLLLLEFTL